MAAAVVAQIPLTEQEAEAAYEALADSGIQDMGNGWYRCWMSFKDETISVHAKSADHSRWMAMYHGKVCAYFDLETGELGQINVVEKLPDGTVKSGVAGFYSDGAYLWGAQLEKK